MAGIKGLEGLSPSQLQNELARGGRFVVFEYCVSILVKTFRRASDVYFVRAGEGTLALSAGYNLLSLLLGWWGFPWGLIYTPLCLATNLSGGKDVTEQVVTALLAPRYVPGECE
jgi:hypothetical protein